MGVCIGGNPLKPYLSKDEQENFTSFDINFMSAVGGRKELFKKKRQNIDFAEAEIALVELRRVGFISPTCLKCDACAFSCASFCQYEKLVGRFPPTQTPTEMLKRGLSIFTSQGMESKSVSFQTIFEALQSDLFRFKFHSLGLKILKIPEFNLFYEPRQVRPFKSSQNHHLRYHSFIS